MPNSITKANYRKKRRSCPMCKPHKMHGADSRKLSDKKADQSRLEQITESNGNDCRKS